MSEFDNPVTPEEMKAFADYCVDIRATLKAYWFTPERFRDVASEIVVNFYKHESDIGDYLKGVPVPEDSGILPIRLGDQSFENATTTDLYRSARNIQDRTRITRNRTQNGYMRIVLQVAKGVANSRDLLPEKGVSEVRLAVLGDMGMMLGYARDCPDRIDLGIYVNGKLSPDDNERVDRHLRECDVCASDAYQIEEEIAAEAARKPDDKMFEFFDSQFKNGPD